MEGLRQGRDHHLGDPADRLPLGRPRPSRVRAPRLPARRGLLLVHLLAHPGALPVRRAACWSRCTARPSERLGDPVLAWARDRRRPGASAAATSRPAARAAWCGSAGPRPIEMVAAAHVHTIKTYGPDRVRRLLADPGDVDGVALRRHPVHPAHRRRDDVVLRLVRRPAGRQPAGLRRPDRRPGVRRLVGRDLPDDVGLQRPRHPHPGRALDGRGPLPRHQGRHGQPRLRRQHQVRRRVAARPGRHRRGAGDGHGSRDAQGVLRRPPDAVLRRLRPAPTPTCRSWSASTSTTVPSGAAWCPGKFLTAADLGRRRRAGRGPRGRPCCSTRATGEPVVPNGSMGFRYAESGVGKWNLDLEGVDAGALAARRRRRSEAVEVLLPAFDDADGSGVGAAPRRARLAASAATWSPRSST